jgi:hypothetical protein
MPTRCPFSVKTLLPNFIYFLFDDSNKSAPTLFDCQPFLMAFVRLNKFTNNIGTYLQFIKITVKDSPFPLTTSNVSCHRMAMKHTYHLQA